LSDAKDSGGGAAMTYTVVLERERDGGFSVHVPALKGCHTQGDDLPEALDMARDAIECYLGSLVKHGEPILGDASLVEPRCRHPH